MIDRQDYPALKRLPSTGEQDFPSGLEIGRQDGVNSFDRLLTQLSDVPTPAGPTPRQLQDGLVQIEPTSERRK